MKARELCEKAWQEIASHFPDFKVKKFIILVIKTNKLWKLSENVFFF